MSLAPSLWEEKEVIKECDGSAIPFAFTGLTLDPSSPVPIYSQISQYIRATIHSGELPAGTLLPTSHALAEQLGTARNTVVAAYTRLVNEGLCVSNKRRGTRVADAFQLPPASPDLPAKNWEMVRSDTRLGYFVKDALNSKIARSQDGTPFALSTSDPVLYPRTKLGRRLADEFLGAPRQDTKSGGYDNDVSRLQSALALHLRQAHGVVCSPEQVLPVLGLEAASKIVAVALIDPGDIVAIEDPAMDVVCRAFDSTRAILRPLHCDAHGVIPGSLENGPPSRVIVVSPSLSFPFGKQMPLERRKALLNLSRAQNAIIFENDAYGDLRLGGERLRALQGLDSDERVIYYGGFSAVLGSSINVGYLVVPRSLAGACAEIGRRLANLPAPQLQSALAEFIVRNDFAAHVREVRGKFAERLNLVRDACRRHLPLVGLSEPLGGVFLVLDFSAQTDEAELCRASIADGLPIQPLSHFCFNTKPNGLVLSIGAVPEQHIEATISRLAELASRTGGSDKRPQPSPNAQTRLWPSRRKRNRTATMAR